MERNGITKMNILLNELESWLHVKNKPLWVERVASEIPTETLKELIKAKRLLEENEKASKFLDKALSEELDRRIDFLM